MKTVARENEYYDFWVPASVFLNSNSKIKRILKYTKIVLICFSCFIQNRFWIKTTSIFKCQRMFGTVGNYILSESPDQ